MTAKAKILIVDDEANTLASLSRAFRLAGHEAVVCDNAARALELAFARLRVRGHIEEAPEKRVVEQWIALTRFFFDGAACGDVDDRGRHALDHGGKRGHRLGVRRRGNCGEQRS